MDGITPEHVGNLHLVFLHLPIGFVVAAALLEFRRWRRPSEEGTWLQGRLLAANAVVALMTAGFGLVLASTGSYAAETLALHRWAGVTCAGLAAVAWLAHARGGVWLARGALAGLFLATVVTGHLGATLTHGKEATSWWLPEAAAKPVTATKAAEAGAAVTTVTAEGTVFAHEVQPLLERSCVKCHGPVKVKGGLRLDSRVAALAAGKSGKRAVVPGKPEESELLRRVKLPRDDDDAMPAGDGPGLTAAEITLLEKWIADGAR